MRPGPGPRYPVAMKRFTILLAAALLAPCLAAAQNAASTPMRMPGSQFPTFPVPTPIPVPVPGLPLPMPSLPGPIPVQYEYLPNFNTVVPGLPLPGTIPAGRLAAPVKRAPVLPVATAKPRPSAARFEKTLEILRDQFGLDETGGLKSGAKPETTSASFDGSAKVEPVASASNDRPVQRIPERELERDLGVK